MAIRADDSGEGVAELVRAARGGNLHAFDALVARYQDAMYGVAYAMLGNRPDAEDAAQHALIQAWRRLGSLREEDRFSAWLYRITQNHCRNLRSRSPGVLPLRHAELLPAAERPRGDGDLEEAMAELSEPHRLVLGLFYVGGYRVGEIASMLGIPAGTVKRRLHDARKRLHGRLPGLEAGLKSGKPSNDPRFAAVISIVNAAWSGDLGRVKRLLRDFPALIDTRDGDGWLPLHHAARQGHVDVVRALLDHAADPNGRDAVFGWTPLHLAIEGEHPEVEETLVEAGAELGIVAAAQLGRVDVVAGLLDRQPGLALDWGSGSGPLHWAAGAGHLDVVRLLLDRGADVDARSRNAFRNTPLHVAVMRGRPEVARLLLERGAGVSVLDGFSATPLHMMAKYPNRDTSRDPEVLSLLLAHGVEVDIANPAGETPLHWAATRGDRRVAGMLLAHGARLDLFTAAALGRIEALAAFLEDDPVLATRPGPDGLAPLHFAAYGGSAEAIGFLLEHGADLEARGGWFGGTPLHLAAYQGRVEIVERLVACGADPDARDAAGWTPLHQLRFAWWTPPSNRPEIVNVLLAAGARLNARNDVGETPLHVAADRGHAQLVASLLAAGADADAQDSLGRTPLQRAAARRHVEAGLAFKDFQTYSATDTQ